MASKDKTSAIGDSLGVRNTPSLLKKRGLSDFPQIFLSDCGAVPTPGAYPPGHVDDDRVIKRLKIAKNEPASGQIDDADELTRNEQYQYFQKRIYSFIKKVSIFVFVKNSWGV